MTSTHRRAAGARQAVLAGIFLMLFGCLLSSANGALSKALLVTFPVGVVLLIRNLSALTLGLPFVRASAFRHIPQPVLQAFRLSLCAIETPIYLIAISKLPLVDVLTYYMAAPIYVTVLSATLLKEPVGWRRWSAVTVGFIGVLIALNPSSATISAPALIALSGGVLYAAIMTTTRALRGTSNVVLVATQLIGAIIAAAILAPFNWVTPGFGDVLSIAVIGVFTLITTTCVNRALKIAPASTVVPFQYTLIVGSAFFGYVFFGEVPSTTIAIGAAIIIVAGLYIFMRELKVAPKPPVVEAP